MSVESDSGGVSEDADKVYQYIVGYMIGSTGIPPTRKEIMEGTGIRTAKRVTGALQYLEDTGKITRVKRSGTSDCVSRSIRVVGARYEIERVETEEAVGD